MPQIQGVQGRMPYAAAEQQPSTASPWHALVSQAPEIGVSSAFPKGKQNGEKKEHLLLIITVDINRALKTVKSV